MFDILCTESEMNESGFQQLSEASINSIIKHSVTGFVVVSANKSNIFYKNKSISLENEFINWLKEEQPNTYVEKIEMINDIMVKFSSNKDFQKLNAEMEQKLQECNLFLSIYNNRSDKDLQRDIISNGNSYIPVYGGYKSTSNDGNDVYERSFVIFNKNRKGETLQFDELKNFAIEMCKKYKQESVYIQEPSENNIPPYYVDGNGTTISNVQKSSNNFNFNDYQKEYFTSLKRKKGNNAHRFTSDIVFDSEIQDDIIPLYYKKFSGRTDWMKRANDNEFCLTSLLGHIYDMQPSYGMSNSWMKKNMKCISPKIKLVENEEVIVKHGFDPLFDFNKDVYSHVLFKNINNMSDDEVRLKMTDSFSPNGIITIALDVNSDNLNIDDIVDYIGNQYEENKSKVETNSLFNKNKIINNNYIWSIGKYLTNDYLYEDSMFNDESIVIPIQGLSFKVIVEIANNLANHLKRNNMMVTNCNNNKSYIIKIN